MKNNFIYKTVTAILVVIVILTGSIAISSTVIANTLTPINELFPDPVLAELIAINLGLTVDDAVTDAQLHDILVLNLDPAERVEDFTGVGLLINIEHLYADYQGLEHVNWFSALTNLRVVDISGNYVTDLSPLNGNPHLTDLRIVGNDVIYFGEFNDLYLQSLVRTDTWIELRGAEVSFADFAELIDLPYLRHLSIYDMVLDNQTLNILGSLTNLEYLLLFDVEFGNPGFISNLTNLKSLVITNREFENLNFVENLINLEELVLIGSQNISDLRPLSRLSSLRRLEISESQIEDVSPLSGLTNLNFVNLSQNNIYNLRPLAGLNAEVTALFQHTIRPWTRVGDLQELAVYGVNGNDLTIDFQVGIGTFEDGMILWKEEGHNRLFWRSADFSGWLLQDVWQFNHDWYAEHLCEDEICEVYYPYGEDCDEWIRITEICDAECYAILLAYENDREIFDYDYYHGNLNLEVGIVETEFYCPADCDAYVVEDQSGHTPEDEIEDDFGYDDDDLIHDDNVDWWLDWDDDDYWWLDWDPGVDDIGTDPDFDVEAWLAEYFASGSAGGGGNVVSDGDDETNENDGDVDNNYQPSVDNGNNNNDITNNNVQSDVDNDDGGFIVDVGVVGDNNDNGDNYGYTDEDVDNYIGSDTDNVLVDNSQIENGNDTNIQSNDNRYVGLLLVEDSRNLLPILVISGVGIVLIGISAGAVMLKRKPETKSGD